MGALNTSRRRISFAVAAGLAVLAAVGASLGITASRPAPTGARVDAPVAARSGSESPQYRPSRVDYRWLDARIALLMQDPDMVGLAVGAVEGGRIRFVKGYGETRAGSGIPVTPDTVFRWASLSKAVASALVVDLAMQKRLALDTPVAAMGTTLTLPGDFRRVTIADVLSHRVGLVRNAWDDRLEAGEDPRVLRAALGAVPAYCKPATCYAYQNIAFDTATEIVERTTRRNYAAVAETRLFTPLGMTSTSIGRAGLQRTSNWAHPHRRGKSPAAVEEIYYRVPAAGGVNSSILDLIRWMGAQMGDAPGVLPRQALEAMHRPRVATPPHGRRGPMDRALSNAAYGLGWRIFSYAGRRLVGHRGSVDGYGALILFDPSDRSGIVMLWNSNHHQAARLQLEFFDMLYGLPPTNWLELPARPHGGRGPVVDRGAHEPRGAVEKASRYP